MFIGLVDTPVDTPDTPVGTYIMMFIGLVDTPVYIMMFIGLVDTPVDT